MKKRNVYIDILRAIAILLVIVGHIPYPTFSPILHKFIYAFHIPLFFFVSGMTLSFQDYSKFNFKQMLAKRFHRIYLPYLLWGIILAFPNFSLVTIPKIIYGTHQSIASVTNSSLWFLPVLFLSLIILDLIFVTLTKRKKQNKNQKEETKQSAISSLALFDISYFHTQTKHHSIIFIRTQSSFRHRYRSNGNSFYSFWVFIPNHKIYPSKNSFSYLLNHHNLISFSCILH